MHCCASLQHAGQVYAGPKPCRCSALYTSQVVAPYLDQQTALCLRLTCSAASCCAQAVHELGHVLGSAKDATASEAIHTAFAAAVEAFPECSSVRVFCVLRRAISPTEVSAFSTALQQLPKLHSLMLSEVKGQGSLRRPSNSTGHGTGAILPYLPLLADQLQSLHIKCLRPPSNTATVLPRLQQLSMLCLDSVEGFSPQVLAAVGQLRGLRQVTVCLKHDWPLGQRLWTRSNGLEHLAPLSQLSVLQVNLVGALPVSCSCCNVLCCLVTCQVGSILLKLSAIYPQPYQPRAISVIDRACRVPVCLMRHASCLRGCKGEVLSGLVSSTM